jgi:hypothetical protein
VPWVSTFYQEEKNIQSYEKEKKRGRGKEIKIEIE